MLEDIYSQDLKLEILYRVLGSFMLYIFEHIVFFFSFKVAEDVLGKYNVIKKKNQKKKQDSLNGIPSDQRNGEWDEVARMREEAERRWSNGTI